MQIQKQQLENLNSIITYESINNHNNKYKQKDINNDKDNITKVRNPKPQKRDNELYNTDY